MSDKRKVLLVEDNRLASLAAAMVITRAGCAVDAVSSGEAACELADRNRYDLILMDIGLPGMVDGFQTVANIRLLEKNVATPVCMLTAHKIGVAIDKKPTSLNIHAILEKPLTLEVFQAILLDLH